MHGAIERKAAIEDPSKYQWLDSLVNQNNSSWIRIQKSTFPSFRWMVGGTCVHTFVDKEMRSWIPKSHFVTSCETEGVCFHPLRILEVETMLERILENEPGKNWSDKVVKAQMIFLKSVDQTVARRRKWCETLLCGFSEGYLSAEQSTLYFHPLLRFI